MGVIFLQFFPPAPTPTEQKLTSQTGKVFIITGGTSVVGLELATILYRAGGRVYIAGRSEPALKNVSSISNHHQRQGVSQPVLGSVSKQGFELQMATNYLGPFLFTQYLLPCLKAAAKYSKPDAVRVVWTHPQFSELTAPKDGIILSELDTPPED
ncbi:hypothetical protein BPAE_0012g00410 [Botrytis paeoniae]|uniref:Ketoreductase (KR) domain-containing protein n=1 Tax=Botrytis paeoniae TaxID=278948 RepID=A0A4Z1FYA2_9HELO|nr:hypothetical protein BPAE_0012g00410 [Botrytis paeoniae]